MALDAERLKHLGACWPARTAQRQPSLSLLELLPLAAACLSTTLHGIGSHAATLTPSCPHGIPPNPHA
jgi:hypothetical protein